MAGIGFALRKLTRRDDLLGILQGYAHSALVSTGPWVFTVLSLAGISVLSNGSMAVEELNTFRLIVIYNFAFSLVGTGPVLMVATRYLADQIFLKKVDGVVGMFLGALGMLCVVQFPVVAGFYFFHIDTESSMQLLAVANYMVVTGIWLVGIFLTALKDYGAITFAFFIGMVTAGIAALLLSSAWGGAGLLLGFTAGLAVILFALVARLLSEYPYRVEQPFAFLSYFRRFWELSVAGLVLNMAIWADKWIMWFAPERDLRASGFISYPDYDTAMFLAYLTVIPAIAGFIVSVETSFFERYLRFYRDIQRHATFAQIEDNQRNLVSTVLRGLRNLVVLQGSVTFLAIVLAPRLIASFGLPASQLGMLRIGMLGSFFHALTLSLAVFLAYFDLRKPMLLVYGVLLASNVGFTLVTLHLGFPYYGYGYFLSALTSFAAAVMVLAYYLDRLPYLTFVRSNTSIQ